MMSYYIYYFLCGEEWNEKDEMEWGKVIFDIFSKKAVVCWEE